METRADSLILKKYCLFLSGTENQAPNSRPEKYRLHMFSFTVVVILERDEVPLTKSGLVILKDVKNQECFPSWYLVLNLEHSEVSLYHALLQSKNISMFPRLFLKFPFDFFTKGKKGEKKERKWKPERWK